jgi:hypothetical protein
MVQWQVIVALVVMIPVILFPVLFIWYLNVGGIYAAIKARQAAREQSKKGKVSAGAMPHAAVAANEESVRR